MRASLRTKRFSVQCSEAKRQILMIARRMDFKLDFRITVDVIFGESDGRSKNATRAEKEKK